MRHRNFVSGDIRRSHTRRLQAVIDEIWNAHSSRNHRDSVGVETGSGRRFLAIPISDQMVDS